MSEAGADGLIPALEGALPPGRVRARAIDLAVYACDASVYRIVPRAVVDARAVDDVRAVLRVAAERGVPVTFRAAGTSLSGQAVGPGVIVDVSRGWKGLRIEERGARVRVEPGVIGGHLNAALRPFARRLGPDPASIDACMLGGILANDASGMCCGTADGAFRSVESLRVLLASGVLVDTADPARLALDAPVLAAGLTRLRARLLARPDLVEGVRARRRIKNTTGYALDALLDWEHPADILARLLIGSEGTLGFIAEAVLRTVPEPPARLTTLLLFDDLAAAVDAVDGLVRSEARAIELLDRACLRAVARRPGVPAGLDELPPAAAALLVEWASDSEAGLEARRAAARGVVGGLHLLRPPELVSDARRRGALWAVRKGVFPSVGAARAPGTAVVIEDVAFPRPALAQAALELQALLAEHGWGDAVVFGHAREGNLHFVLTPRLDDPAEVRRYDAFMRALVRLVLAHGGSLKAEHGTGRNMAPFVEAAWGAELYGLMRELKDLLDPAGILNPGVLLTSDPDAHVRHLKDLPSIAPKGRSGGAGDGAARVSRVAIDPVEHDGVAAGSGAAHAADRCIECGFCEPACPSRQLTLTPRQRIVALRAAARDPSEAAAILRDWSWEGRDTCAGDGLCATACPVEIDTGALVRAERARERGPLARAAARALVPRLGALERAARAGLGLAWLASELVGDARLSRWSRVGSRALGRSVPAWSAGLPHAARPPQLRSGAPGTASPALPLGFVFARTCTGRVLGAPRGEPKHPSPAEAFARVAQRAGVAVRAPALTGRCCGLPFAAKGFPEARQTALVAFVDALWRASDRGRVPVVLDASSCVQALRSADELLRGRALAPSLARWRALTVLHPAEALEPLLPRLALQPAGVVALHPTCGARKLGLSASLLAVARACASEVHVPPSLSCCGAGGDRGLFAPELPEAALESEAAELSAVAPSACYADNPACEATLRAATGQPFRNLIHLVEEASRI